MDEFSLVEEGGGSLTFFDRRPSDHRLPLDEYQVRLDVAGLTATRSILAADEIYLLELFETLSREWRTASETREWAARESDLGIKVVPDRLGHFTIEVSMVRWFRWEVTGSHITIVTTQLDEVVAGLKAFFGKLTGP